MEELTAKAPRARYRLNPETYNPEKGYVWTDIIEAVPHCRARLQANQTASCYVTVDGDGRLEYDPHLVEVDVYQTP